MESCFVHQRVLRIEHKQSPVSPFVTASMGVTTVQYSPAISPAEVVAMADKLLYKARVAGRDRIECGVAGESLCLIDTNQDGAAYMLLHSCSYY